MILIVINQGLQAITDFWAALSVTLVIDEANVRKRKIEGPDAPSVEGRYLGVLNTCYSMGVAISSSALLLGLGQSGLDVRDCIEFEDDETLREQCYKADQAQQPYGARMYIRVVFFAIAPIFLVCMGLSISQFPIWGERLRKLELEKSAQESTSYNIFLLLNTRFVHTHTIFQTHTQALAIKAPPQTMVWSCHLWVCHLNPRRVMMWKMLIMGCNIFVHWFVCMINKKLIL